MYNRNIERPSPTKNIFKFASCKINDIVTVESSLEYLACFHFEYSDDVETFESQPTGYKYNFKGKECSYTPDFKLVYISGKTVFVEVKPSYRAGESDFIARFPYKIAAAKDMGLNLILLTEQTLNASPYIDNLKILHRYQGVQSPKEVHNLVLHSMSKNRQISIQDLSRNIDVNVGLVLQAVVQLILRRELLCDLKQQALNEKFIIGSM
ncbi:MAG: TnsA endonuclease N-terminal domain-containing protein [Colwellia sp.]|jgi:TnsA endonuclease C terminal./TnsA endonuclease N terminal.